MKSEDLDKVELQQKAIIEAIEKELGKDNSIYKPQGMFHSVWFLPDVGEFMYNDTLVKNEVIKPLIEVKKLIYKGIEKHQGKQMPRYVLS